MSEFKSLLHDLNKESNLPHEQKAEFFKVLIKAYLRAEILDGQPRARIQLWELCHHPKIIRFNIQMRAKRITLSQLPQQVFDLLMRPLDRHLAESAALWDPIERAYIFMSTLVSCYCRPALILVALATATGFAAAAGVGHGLHNYPFWHYTLSALNWSSTLLATTSLGLGLAIIFLMLLGLLDRPDYLTKSPSLC